MATGRIVILTGASGSGKTTLAEALVLGGGGFEVAMADSIGVPSAEKMRESGEGYEPGGAWQRAMTIEWMGRLAPRMRTGVNVLFEGQMRIAFITEAIEKEGIAGDARIILVDCDDTTRASRLDEKRRQPELADANMMNWAKYLRGEAEELGIEVMDTGTESFGECVERLKGYLVG